MKRVYCIFLILSLLGFCGCEVVPSPAPNGTLKVDHGANVARLNSGISSFEITFTSTCDWNIAIHGRDFEISPMSGKGSTTPQTITVTSLCQNLGNATIERGSFNICLKGYSTKYNIKVEQCAKSNRTIFAWFFGTSLSYYFGVNADCMKDAISKDILGNDRFLLFIQTSRNNALIKELYYDAKENKCKESIFGQISLPEKLTGEQFGEYLAEMMNIAPAERYAMIVGGHSTAWLPALPSSGGVPLSVGEYMPDWTPVPGAEITRNIGENNVKLDIADFAEGLSYTGKKFDWLYFDVCFMSSLEASYELRNLTDYIVASPCEIMGYGSPFDLLLENLVVDDLNGACDIYTTFYQYTHSGSKSGCIATIVCSELDELAAKAKALNETATVTDLNIFSVQSFEGRSSHIFFDTEDYVLKAYDNATLVDAFCKQLDKTVINRYHTDKFYSVYNGKMNDINHYSGLNFTPNEDCIAVLESQIAALKSGANADLSTLGLLEDQCDELKKYLPYLQETAWYKATH